MCKHIHTFDCTRANTLEIVLYNFITDNPIINLNTGDTPATVTYVILGDVMICSPTYIFVTLRDSYFTIVAYTWSYSIDLFTIMFYDIHNNVQLYDGKHTLNNVINCMIASMLHWCPQLSKAISVNTSPFSERLNCNKT